MKNNNAELVDEVKDLLIGSSDTVECMAVEIISKVEASLIDRCVETFAKLLKKSGNPNRYELADISKRRLLEDLTKALQAMKGEQLEGEADG